MNRSFFLCSIFLILFSCTGKNSEKQSSMGNQADSSVFRLNEPSQVYELPKKLEEVSGMAAVSNNQLLINEDENGKLYLFNLRDGSLEKEVKWGEKGDYEGTAVVGNTAYVVNSEGTIFRIENFLSGSPEVEKYENKALEKYDVEGLHFLEEENVLLLACKEGTGREDRKVYSFSLETHALQPEPYRVFDLKEIEEGLITTGIDKFSVELKKMLDPGGESGIFFPSGIATHPETGEWFILSSKSRLLVVYDSAGKLKNVVELRNELYRQPEAISFTPNGDLYIGNEGNGGKANILKFEYGKE